MQGGDYDDYLSLQFSNTCWAKHYNGMFGEWNKFLKNKGLFLFQVTMMTVLLNQEWQPERLGK